MEQSRLSPRNIVCMYIDIYDGSAGESVREKVPNIL
jgi:hypothetical protein